MLQVSECSINSLRLFHMFIHRSQNRGWNQEWILTPETSSRIVISRTMPDLVAHVDGSCLGSPGPSGIGVIISGFKDGPITVAKWIGHQDNNVAEYMALLEA